MNPPTFEVFYFGADRRDTGHYWHGVNTSIDPPPGSPFGWNIDGGFAPRVGPDPRRRHDLIDYRPEAPQGQAALVHREGWTVLAYWDRSGDSRHASNSAFVARGEHTFDEMLAAARQQWGRVFERQRFDVVPFASPTPDDTEESDAS